MQSPTEQLKVMLREWIDLKLPRTCVAGDTYTRLSINHNENTITFTSRYRGRDTNYLIATIVGDDFEFTSPVNEDGQYRQCICQAQYCIELTLNSY